MKKILCFLFILLWLISPAFAQDDDDTVTVGSIAAVGGPTCTFGSGDSELSSFYGDTDNSGDPFNATTWRCMKHTFAANSTVTGYIARTDKDSDNNVFTFVAELYNHDAVNDYPDETSLIANTTISTSVTAGDWTGAAADRNLQLASPKEGIASGTVVWICFRAPSLTTGYPILERDTGDGSDRMCSTANSGSTWTCSTVQCRSKIMGCAE